MTNKKEDNFEENLGSVFEKSEIKKES